MLLVTLVKLNVRRVPTVLLLTVTTLPAEPVMLHVSMVPKFEAKVTVWATVLVEANSVNELAFSRRQIDVLVAPPMVSLL